MSTGETYIYSSESAEMLRHFLLTNFPDSIVTFQTGHNIFLDLVSVLSRVRATSPEDLLSIFDKLHELIEETNHIPWTQLTISSRHYSSHSLESITDKLRTYLRMNLPFYELGNVERLFSISGSETLITIYERGNQSRLGLLH